MARRTAERFAQRHGRPYFVAAVEVAPGGPLRAVKFPRSSDHYNLIGSPADCLAKARMMPPG